MRMKVNSLIASSFTVLLVACGGSSAPEPAQPTQEQRYQALLTEANAAQAEAIKNAASGPCTADNQCSTLAFRDPSPPCHVKTFVDYSTASPTAAAASAAANHYASVASQAEAIAPPSNVSGTCWTNVDMTPLICDQGSCKHGFRIVGP